MLTHIKSDWVAMAPSTALCFLLSGLAILNNRQSLHVPVSLSQRGFIWLVILLAGTRITDLLFAHQSGLESLISVTHYDISVHMAPQTAIGFLLFSGGMLAIHRAENRRAEIAARIMAGTLLFIGLFSAIGFWLNFKYIFRNLYNGTRLDWMAFHTAVGFSMLGLGLFCLALNCKLRDEANAVEQQAILIYRSTLLVLCTTAIITGLIGLSYLEQTIKQQASSNMTQLFVAKAKMNIAEEREWTYVRKDGSRFPVLLSVTALRDEDNIISGFLGIAYDISERKRNDEYIRHIALHDVLTGLPNRALLDDRVMVAIEHQRRNNIPFALAMMDIDRFKNINDTMGHHIGDLILKEFVARIKTCLRPTDTLARMGRAWGAHGRRRIRAAAERQRGIGCGNRDGAHTKCIDTADQCRRAGGAYQLEHRDQPVAA